MTRSAELARAHDYTECALCRRSITRGAEYVAVRLEYPGSFKRGSVCMPCAETIVSAVPLPPVPAA